MDTSSSGPHGADGSRPGAFLDHQPARDSGGAETWTAHFTPEAWVRNYTVEVDAEGPTTWDCTRHALANYNYLAHLLTRDRTAADVDHPSLGVVDVHDLFQADPAAPAWVRGWSGPFTIRLSRNTGQVPDLPGDQPVLTLAATFMESEVLAVAAAHGIPPAVALSRAQAAAAGIEDEIARTAHDRMVAAILA